MDPAAGPADRFAAELRELRRAAGGPTYRCHSGRPAPLPLASDGRLARPALAGSLVAQRICARTPGGLSDPDWDRYLPDVDHRTIC